MTLKLISTAALAITLASGAHAYQYDPSEHTWPRSSAAEDEKARKHNERVGKYVFKYGSRLIVRYGLKTKNMGDFGKTVEKHVGKVMGHVGKKAGPVVIPMLEEQFDVSFGSMNMPKSFEEERNESREAYFQKRAEEYAEEQRLEQAERRREQRAELERLRKEREREELESLLEELEKVEEDDEEEQEQEYDDRLAGVDELYAPYTEGGEPLIINGDDPNNWVKSKAPGVALHSPFDEDGNPIVPNGANPRTWAEHSLPSGALLDGLSRTFPTMPKFDGGLGLPRIDFGDNFHPSWITTPRKL